MTLVELYCKMRGHRFVAYKYPNTRFEGFVSKHGRCVRCHETLYLIEEV